MDDSPQAPDRADRFPQGRPRLLRDRVLCGLPVLLRLWHAEVIPAVSMPGWGCRIND